MVFTEQLERLPAFRSTIDLVSHIDEVFGKRIAKDILIIERDLSIALGRAGDLQEALHLILSASRKIGEIDCGGIYLIDPVSKDLVLQAHQELSECFVREASWYPADSPNVRMVTAGIPRYGLTTILGQEIDGIRVNEELLAVA